MTTVEPVVDFTNPPSNETNSMFGLFEPEIINPVEEEPILPESSGGNTRIVNGVDCLPGECPWQVETYNWVLLSFSLLLHETFFGNMKYASLVVISLTSNFLSGSSY